MTSVEISSRDQVIGVIGTLLLLLIWALKAVQLSLFKIVSQLHYWKVLIYFQVCNN